MTIEFRQQECYPSRIQRLSSALALIRYPHFYYKSSTTLLYIAFTTPRRISCLVSRTTGSRVSEAAHSSIFRPLTLSPCDHQPTQQAVLAHSTRPAHHLHPQKLRHHTTSWSVRNITLRLHWEGIGATHFLGAFA